MSRYIHAEPHRNKLECRERSVPPFCAVLDLTHGIVYLFGKDIVNQCSGKGSELSALVLLSISDHLFAHDQKASIVVTDFIVERHRLPAETIKMISTRWPVRWCTR